MKLDKKFEVDYNKKVYCVSDGLPLQQSCHRSGFSFYTQQKVLLVAKAGDRQLRFPFREVWPVFLKS